MPRLALFLLALVAACASTPRAPAPRELTVLVYNVHAGKDAAGKDNLERVAALVREVDADVVLLQELDVNTRRSGGVDQPSVLSRLAGRQVVFGPIFDYQGGQYGIGVLSRWPITGDSVVRLIVNPPQPRAGGAYEPRIALRARIATPWGPLTVVNTHIDASREDTYRRQEVSTILAVARAAVATGVPTLVGGDMNSEPGSAVQDSARAGGLRDAWPECGRGDSLTFPAGTGVKRIDYLYLTGGIRCSDARVLRSDASDHSPVLFRVRVW
ncbi:MAG TPA: endonuclease/exonuclease/phosphatase family protein [Gemmatimonadaceae bacterium]|nr:endonuclease/exonuclease/phosphatase family protein [Gemmatimonadaceae bacterium]